MSFALLTLLREIYCYKLGAVDECSFGLASNQVEKPLDDERPPLLQDGRCHKAYTQEFRVEKAYALASQYVLCRSEASEKRQTQSLKAR